MKKIILAIAICASMFVQTAYASIFEDNFDTYTWSPDAVEGTNYVSEGQMILKGDVTITKSLNEDVSESGTVTIEMKLYLGDCLPATLDFPSISGKDADGGDLTLTRDGINNGKFMMYTRAITSAEANTEYIIKFKLDFAGNTETMAVYDSQNTLLGESSRTFISGSAKVKELSAVTFVLKNKKNSDKDAEVKLDYIMIGDETFKVNLINIEDGDEVQIDKDILMKFNNTPMAESLNNITVKNKAGEDAEYEIKEKDGMYVIYFPYALNYNDEYTLSIPDTVVSEDNIALYGKTLSFKTESYPFYAKNFAVKDKDLNGLTSTSIGADFVNKSAVIRKADILVCIYNGSGELVHVFYKQAEIPEGESRLSYDIDLSGVSGAKSAKAYLWNSLSTMDDVLIAE